MPSRGVVENHIYLSTAETDPHRVLSPAATHPDTAIDGRYPGAGS